MSAIVGGEERARQAAADLRLRLGGLGITLTDDARTAINRAFLAFADEGSGIGELDRAKIAVAIERANVQKIPDGYADGATGQPAIKHEEVSDWSAWLADAVIAASISSREEIAENANCSPATSLQKAQRTIAIELTQE